MKISNTLLDREKISINKLSPIALIATVSGFITYIIQSHAAWQQTLYLLHTAAGILLTVYFFPYIIFHFKRTLGIRRPLIILTGILTTATLVILILTGLYITVFGQHESLRWIYDYHIIAAFSAVILTAAHLILHRYIKDLPRKKFIGNQFTSITTTTFNNVAIWTIASIVITSLLSLAFSAMSTQYFDQAVIKPYQLPYGDHPFRPSQTETITGGFMDVRRVGGSDRCADCHKFITDEWRSSIHSQAGSDKSYQTNVNLMAKKLGMAATRYCEGCHAPVALLSGELTEGGKLNTNGHLHEGVSCMACHGIDRVVHLQGVGSYRFAPANNYLFADKDNFLARKIHNLLIQIQPRQHRADMARPPLSNPTLCATCHTQYIDKDVNNWGWIKMQDEFGAWLKSPYSGQTQQEFSQTKIVRCQDCHMPLIKGNDPSADTSQLVRSHRTLGANTVIPWLNNDQDQLQKTIQFLQSDKVRVSIEEPNRINAVLSKQHLEQNIITDKNSPAYYYLGEKVNLKVIVTNSQVGHNFPGGTLDINEVWINLKVVDAQNKLIYENGAINNDNDVDSDAYFYKSLPIDRNGKHVWKHDLFNMTGNSYKNFVPPGASDIVPYNFTIPSWVKSPISISAVLRYRKFNNRYAKWALKDEKINPPIVDVARHAISLPIRIKKEIN